MESEALRGWRAIEDRTWFAAGAAGGRRQRPALSLVRPGRPGVVIGVASGDDPGLREGARELLTTATRRFERQVPRTPHETVRAFEAAFDTALVFGDLPAGGWGVCALAVLPRSEVFCFTCRGQASLWRGRPGAAFRPVGGVAAGAAAIRKDLGAVRERIATPFFVTPYGAAKAPAVPEPLMTLGAGDRLLLTVGQAATLDEARIAAGASRMGPSRVPGGIIRAALDVHPRSSAGAMLVAMTTPPGQSVVGRDGDAPPMAEMLDAAE